MTTINTNNYSEPAPELIDDIRKRLADVPQEILDRARHALMHEPLQHAGSILYKAGVCLGSHELCEYRKTLFPPNALADPLTQGPPILVDTGAESLSAPPPHDTKPPADNALQLSEARQHLLTVLTARVIAPDSTHSSINPIIHKSNNPASLLSDLRDLITRYVVLPEMAAETLALWVVHTHAFTLREITTYIGVVSPEKRCGKTTLLELLSSLAHEAIAAANISPSALFRVIEEAHPTLIIDEADTFMQARDEMAGILNAGYRKGNAYVVRVREGKPHKPVTPVSRPASCNRAGTDNPLPTNTNPSIHSSSPPSGLVRYSCWCPKVMAAIGRLPETLADRCIVITMQRKMPGEKCERLRELDPTPYRQRCADFVRHHADAIARARPAIPSALNDRAADIWEPLLAIADLAGGDWPDLARRAAEKLSASYDEVTLIGHFLFDVRNWMRLRETDRMLSRELVACMNALPDRPWKDLTRGRDINEYWLGRKMTELGINSKCIRTGQTVGKGYLLSEIDSAFHRYVPNPDLHGAKSG